MKEEEKRLHSNNVTVASKKNASQHDRRSSINKKRRKELAAAADLEEERRLTALLFGNNDIGASSATNRSSFLLSSEPKEQTADETPLFELDRTGDSSLHHDDDDDNDHSGPRGDATNKHRSSSNESIEEEQVDDTEKGAAWVDEDDDTLQVNLLQSSSRLRKLRTSRTEEAATALNGVQLEARLRQRYQSTAQTTARTDWARLADDDETNENSKDDVQEAEVFAMQSSSAPLLASSARQRLPPNILKTVRCPDANQSDPNQSVVQAVHFHPASDEERPLLLTAGLDKTLRFFQVGEDKSEKVHGIHFPKLPIYSASFLGSTGNVLVSGRRSFFYIYDAVAGKIDLVPKIVGREEKSLEKFSASPDGRTIAFCGNDGYVILFDAHSKQWIADLKMNGSVRALTFTPDGEYLLASGSDGDVYRWEVKSRRCVERFVNQDGTITSYLAASSRHLAVGAESGVVNLYTERDFRPWSPRRAALPSGREPIKSIMNLHTSADMVRFNTDGQILAMSTRREKHGLKVLHVPSATVFSNWPTSKTPLNYVWSMDFSPASKFLAVGNDKGKCLLYRLLHYQD